MALISCPECGKEISNKSQTCIYCGCPIHGVHNVTQIKETSKINKRVWVAALVFICVAALVVLTIGISANTLNGEEKHVLKLVEEYQSMLKDPDSLILRGSVVVFREHTDEKGPMEYVFFTASGTNSYGAKVTSTVCFANGQFLGSLDEFPSLSEMLEMDAGEATTYTGAKVALCSPLKMDGNTVRAFSGNNRRCRRGNRCRCRWQSSRCRSRSGAGRCR